MEYDLNRIEFVKKYVIQTSEHIFQICIDWIVHNYIFTKNIFSLCSNIFCEMFYLLIASRLLSSSVFESPPQCFYFQIIYNTKDFYEWKLNLIPIKLQMNYLEKDNWAHLLKHWCAINSSYTILHVQW